MSFGKTQALVERRIRDWGTDMNRAHVLVSRREESDTVPGRLFANRSLPRDRFRYCIRIDDLGVELRVSTFKREVEENYGVQWMAMEDSHERGRE